MVSLGLGTDIDCLTDISSTFALVSGRDNLARAILRRLYTPRGGLKYDPDYGFDLRGRLNDSFTPDRLSALAGEIENECEKDPRVRSCKARVTFVYETSSLTVTMEIRDNDGPFRLILAIDAVTAAILDGSDVQATTVAVASAAPVFVQGEQGIAGPPGPAGAPGGSGSVDIVLDEATIFEANSGSEEFVHGWQATLDGLPGTLTVLLSALAKTASGTATYRVRIGGTIGAVDGTVVLTTTTTSTSYASITGSGTPGNPGGTVPVKITVQSPGASIAASIRSTAIVIK